MITWHAALDALEERLRRQEAVAAMTTGDLPDGTLPEVDGPLPVELRARAVALLERTEQLERLVGARLAAGSPRQTSYGDNTRAAGTDHGAL